VLQPAVTRQSAPFAVRHSAHASTTAKPATNRWRHQPGVPLRPTSRASSAGTLWVATSCCCSLTAPTNPSACTPKPSTPASASTPSAASAPPATRARSRQRAGASTRNGSTRPAVTLMPMPATSAAAPARRRGLAPALASSAPASASSSIVSLWAPPTVSTSSTGFRPTNAALQAGEWPRRAAARASSHTAASAHAAARILYAHRPPATPSGTSA
jgi:hypothetical protein